MDRLFDLFKYDKKYDYERELNASSRTIERCDIVIRQIVRDDYDRMCNKRFDIASSYIVEFEAELVDQVRSAANGGWSFVKVDESLTENQKREFYNWCKDYIPIVKDAIHREVLLLLKDIAYYPDGQSADCLYYNFWGDNFKLFCESSINALGATDEQRASFDVDYNIQFFTLKYEGLKTSMDQSYMIAGILQTPDYSSCIQKSKSLFQDTFNDYIRRILEHGNNIDIVENSGLGWMFFTKRFCEESDSKGIITSTFTSNVVMPILSEMQTNFIADIERKRKMKGVTKVKDSNSAEPDIFEELETKRDKAIRRKVEEAMVLNQSIPSANLKRGRIFFNLWGEDYYKHAKPLFSEDPLPDKKKPLIDRVSNADYFSSKLANTLARYDKSKGIVKDKAVKECAEYLILTLNDYMDFIETDERIYADRYITEAICWYDAAFYAINKAVQTITGDKEKLTDIDEDTLKAIAIYLCSKVSGSLTYLVTGHSKLLDWKMDFVMPYNMIGSEFSDRAKKAAEKYILSHSEKHCVDYCDNVDVFMSFFLDVLKGVEEMAKKDEDYESEINEYVSWAKNVAEDYMTRLTESKPEDGRQFPAQIRLWLWETRLLFSLTLNNEITWMRIESKSDDSSYEELNTNSEKALRAIETTRSKLMSILDEFDNSMESYVFNVISSKVREAKKQSKEQKCQLTTDANDDLLNNNGGIAFSSHLSPEAKAIIKKKIGQELLNNPGYKGLVFIRAAVLENYITDPSYPELMKTYPNIQTKEQNFSGFLGATGKFVTEVTYKNQELLDNARGQLKLLLAKAIES